MTKKSDVDIMILRSCSRYRPLAHHQALGLISSMGVVVALSLWFSTFVYANPKVGSSNTTALECLAGALSNPLDPDYEHKVKLFTQMNDRGVFKLVKPIGSGRFAVVVSAETAGLPDRTSPNPHVLLLPDEYIAQVNLSHDKMDPKSWKFIGPFTPISNIDLGPNGLVIGFRPVMGEEHPALTSDDSSSTDKSTALNQVDSQSGKLATSRVKPTPLPRPIRVANELTVINLKMGKIEGLGGSSLKDQFTISTGGGTSVNSRLWYKAIEPMTIGQSVFFVEPRSGHTLIENRLNPNPPALTPGDDHSFIEGTRALAKATPGSKPESDAHKVGPIYHSTIFGTGDSSFVLSNLSKVERSDGRSKIWAIARRRSGVNNTAGALVEIDPSQTTSIPRSVNSDVRADLLGVSPDGKTAVTISRRFKSESLFHTYDLNVVDVDSDAIIGHAVISRDISSERTTVTPSAVWTDGRDVFVVFAVHGAEADPKKTLSFPINELRPPVKNANQDEEPPDPRFKRVGTLASAIGPKSVISVSPKGLIHSVFYNLLRVDSDNQKQLAHFDIHTTEDGARSTSIDVLRTSMSYGQGPLEGPVIEKETGRLLALRGLELIEISPDTGAPTVLGKISDQQVKPNGFYELKAQEGRLTGFSSAGSFSIDIPRVGSRSLSIKGLLGGKSSPPSIKLHYESFPKELHLPTGTSGTYYNSITAATELPNGERLMVRRTGEIYRISADGKKVLESKKMNAIKNSHPVQMVAWKGRVFLLDYVVSGHENSGESIAQLFEVKTGPQGMELGEPLTLGVPRLHPYDALSSIHATADKLYVNLEDKLFEISNP